MNLEVVEMKEWQNKAFKAFAWIIGFRGEDIHVVTTTKPVYEFTLKELKNHTISKEPNYEGEAYCIKCKEKTSFVGRILVSESGRRMASGLCPRCGTKVKRMLGKA